MNLRGFIKGNLTWTWLDWLRRWFCLPGLIDYAEKSFSSKTFRSKILSCLSESNIFINHINYKKHCQHERSIRWIMTYKPNFYYILMAAFFLLQYSWPKVNVFWYNLIFQGNEVLCLRIKTSCVTTQMKSIEQFWVSHCLIGCKKIDGSH